MKKIGALTVVIVTLFVFSSLVLAAPRMGRGMGGWGMNTKYGRMFNPQTVETVSGEVVKVDKIRPMKGMSYGIHLVVKTESGETSVHLGPAWYIENQDMAVKTGDNVEVKGSKVEMGGKPVIIAAEVKKGEDTLVLRDDAGVPLWSGWRRR
jgi:hypothetical protein